MEFVACDFCGGSESDIVARQTDRLHKTSDEFFNIVRCRQCGLHYTCPRPSVEEIGHYYSSGYSFHSSVKPWRRWIDALLVNWANSPFAIFSAFIPFLERLLVARVKPSISDPVLSYLNSGNKGPFLDIGCGSGVHAHFWGADSSLIACSELTEVAGIEVSSEARSLLLSKGVKCWPDLARVPPTESFGLIRMNWSLEHVHSPNDYFAFIAEFLRPGGRAVIAVPNYEGMIYRLVPDCVELPVHLYHFRPRDIVAYGRRHGLSLVYEKTFSYPGMYFASAEAELLPRNLAGSRGILVARAMQKVLSLFDAAGWGNDLLIVLEKPMADGSTSELS